MDRTPQGRCTATVHTDRRKDGFYQPRQCLNQGNPRCRLHAKDARYGGSEDWSNASAPTRCDCGRTFPAWEWRVHTLDCKPRHRALKARAMYRRSYRIPTDGDNP